MALKNGKPNPLNYFNMRRVDFCPPHFKCTLLNEYNPSYIMNINAWIKFNLNNRYYIGQHLSLDHTNSFVFKTKVGFESEKELSFFTIACPHIYQR